MFSAAQAQQATSPAIESEVQQYVQYACNKVEAEVKRTNHPRAVYVGYTPRIAYPFKCEMEKLGYTVTYENEYDHPMFKISW